MDHARGMIRLPSETDATKLAEQQPPFSGYRPALGNSASSDKGQARPIFLLVASGILLVAAITVGIAITIINLRSSALSDSKRELENTALLVAKHIDRQIEELENVQNDILKQIRSLEIASRDDFERKMSGDDISFQFKNRLSGFSHIDTIVLIDSEGVVINASSDQWSRSLNFTDRDYFKVLKSDPEKALYISEPIRGRIGGDWKVIVAHKINAPDGTFLGLILGSVKLNVFEDYFRSIVLGEGGLVTLLRNDGIVLARYPRIESTIGRAYKGMISALGKLDHGTVILAGRMEDKQLILAGQRLGRHQLVVAVGMDTAFALANWWKQTIALISMGGVAALLIASAVFMIVRQLLQGKMVFQQKIEDQKRQLDTAMNNMTQGLVMFNSAGQLVVCNDRYRRLYDLPLALAKPGCPVIELLKCRAANGTFSGNPEEYVQNLLIKLAEGKIVKQYAELNDGRTIVVVNQPMGSGGWVATHEDVTEAKQRELSFRLLFKSSPVPMWVYDRATLRFLAVNDSAVAHYGFSREQFITMTILDVRPADERTRLVQFISKNGVVHDGEMTWPHMKSDGTKINVNIYSRALSYEGHAAALVAIIDITEREQAKENLHRTQKFLDTIIEHVPAAILVKDVQDSTEGTRLCRYSLINRACEQLLGIPRSKIIGKTVEEIYPKERAEYITAENNEALRSVSPIVVPDHLVHTPGNGTRVATAKSIAVRDDSGKAQYLLTVLDDVTDRRRAEQRIAHMAHHDTLTGLPNRAAFNEFFAATLGQAAANGNRFTILSIDLDRFKEANDLFGHTIGDALLREVALRLQKAAGGVFLARIGGDEFMLIVTDGPQPAAASTVAERLFAAFVDDFEVEGRRLQIGLTIGGAVYPANGADAKTLMINSDAALYRAKAESRGSLMFFEPEMGARLGERLALQEDLRAAVAGDELFLYYQPQFKMTGETIGFESLVRWKCPKRGVVSPGTFIPIAEESGLIIPLGEWVLREACREASTWREPLTIAVNISPVQFHHGDLPKIVHSILLETGLSPARLELEITEGVLIDDFSRAVSILRRLKSLGVQIALDDFGTGYSSLSYLHSFAFDKIKIDQAFIRDLDHNRHSMAIVRAVIGLGHGLEVPILAEGVETEIQHAFLMQEGCDAMQGYLTGRPLPIVDYARLIGREACCLQISTKTDGAVQLSAVS